MAARSVADRLWEKVDKSTTPNGCWPWYGHKDKLGYGRMGVGRYRVLLTHRIAFEVSIGPIPEGLCVCHACDNPSCCNPSHLWIGTRQDNNADKMAKGRMPSGEVHHCAKLNAESVRGIASKHEAGARVVDLAREYGVSESTVCDIVHGRTWTRVTHGGAS